MKKAKMNQVRKAREIRNQELIDFNKEKESLKMK